ncbi:MAG: RNA methyltransferase [Flavobacteriales bacterium]|nr:RNA methyltransferase [Flavobacteriales bacterium]
MITKNYIKFVQSLHQKKYRQKYTQFIVEGEKSVIELINSDFEICEINASIEWIEKNANHLKNQKIQEASKADLERMSFFKTPSEVIAVVNQKKHKKPNLSQKKILCLDGINDPGNLGTIVRIADWYGLNYIFCSPDTVDFYNPKTISSTMGSFTRVEVIYIDLVSLLGSIHLPILFAEMEGQSVYETTEKEAILVIGSEANGISNELKSVQHQSITIPKFGKAESLNAAVATAILCDRIFGG